jgi:hypothetical protein
MVCIELWIYAPGYRFTIGAGSVESASAEILLKGKRIRAVHIRIACQITIAGRRIATRIIEGAPAEILLESKGVGAVLIQIAIKVAFAFTRIATSIALWGQGV